MCVRQSVLLCVSISRSALPTSQVCSCALQLLQRWRRQASSFRVDCSGGNRHLRQRNRDDKRSSIRFKSPVASRVMRCTTFPLDLQEMCTLPATCVTPCTPRRHADRLVAPPSFSARSKPPITSSAFHPEPTYTAATAAIGTTADAGGWHPYQKQCAPLPRPSDSGADRRACQLDSLARDFRSCGSADPSI